MRETGTFSFKLDESNAANVGVYEIFNAETETDRIVAGIDSRIPFTVSCFVESLRLSVYLPSFVSASFPATYPEDSTAERAAKLLAVESQYPKVGLGLYRRKSDVSQWEKLSTVILQNRGRESQLSVLIPYLTVNQVKILSRNDRLGVSCIDLGDGSIGGGEIVNNRPLDYVQIEGEYRFDIDTDENLIPGVFLRKSDSGNAGLSADVVLNTYSQRAYFEFQNTGENPIKLAYSQSGLNDPIIVYPQQMYYPLLVRGLCISEPLWVQAVQNSSTYTVYEYGYQ